jgi:hypothetical protein
MLTSVIMGDNDDGLLQLILDERLAAKSWFDIEKKHGIPMEEAKRIYNEARMSTASSDPIEMRHLQQMRIEKLIEYLWKGLEQGSFKHGEVILKAMERLSNLLDLDQTTLKRQLTIISDEETLQIFEVLKRFANSLEGRVRELDLTPEQQVSLSAWPEWVAESATNSVEQVVYAEVED